MIWKGRKGWKGRRGGAKVLPHLPFPAYLPFTQCEDLSVGQAESIGFFGSAAISIFAQW